MINDITDAERRFMLKVNAISSDNTNNTSSVKTNNNTGKTNFSSYLGETKSLDSIFSEAAEKYNVSVDLLKAIGKAESNFNANAVSRCGAQGIMQLMPATAESLGVKDSFDAEQNIMGGAKYISSLMDKYDGDVKLALAAYNAGMGNVAKYGGIPPFEETQNYVVKVVNYMNQGVDTGNASVTVPTVTKVATSITNITTTNNTNFISDSSENSDATVQDLNAIFSSNDYKEFLEKYLLDEDEDKKEKEKEKENNPNYFASKSINYNVAVMNLLKS